jgi:hypothetical protein
MQSRTQTAVSIKLWAGRFIAALPAVLLLITASLKFARAPVAVALMARLGYPDHLMLPIGLLELTCALIYLIPRTSVLGAILLTGYLGGATASRVRVADPLLVPLLAGTLVWVGLFLREDRLRALIPLRTKTKIRPGQGQAADNNEGV